MSINILIADDHPLVRRGLTNLIKSKKEFNLVAEASDGLEALSFLKQSKIDVALLDIQMPKYTGLELLNLIRHKKLPVKVIILTIYNDMAFAKSAFEQGADGYLLKEETESQITNYIFKVLDGKKVSSLGDIENTPASKHELLSDTEKRVLNLIGSSKSSLEISYMLDVSIRTVDTHRSRIASKLKLKGSNALLKYALLNKDYLPNPK